MNQSLLHFQNESFASTQPSVEAEKVPARGEIADAFKWNLSDIYADAQMFENAYKSFNENVDAIAAYKGKLQNARDLAACLKMRDVFGETVGKLYAYARMHRDSDATNTSYQAMTAKVESLLAVVSGATSFIEPELLAVGEREIKSMMESSELHEYRFYLMDLLRQNRHVLSGAEEELLAKAGEVLKAPGNIYTLMTNADLEFPETLTDSGNRVRLSEGRYNALIRSTDRKVREDAFKNLFGTYAKFRNTFAATLGSSIRTSVFLAKTRKYDSALEAALDAGNVPIDVYKNLIRTVRAKLAPLHRFVDLKQRALGLDKIHMYDLYVPLVEETQKKIAFEDGLCLVKDALKPLGDTYIADLNSGMANGWIDRYENLGKKNGAYSWGVYGVHPFVLLNYDDRYGAVSTLAHELGHAMHSFYSSKEQSYVNASYTIFCAEVASTTNEILLLDYMLKIESDPKIRMYYINQYLEQVRTTVYRQTMFAEFELIVHEKAERGESLTADDFDAVWRELNADYYGDQIVLDDGIQAEWSRIPHFYRPFYVYQYATGYSAASALADRILQTGDTAKEDYLSFLKSGGSDYSLNLLKNAGADMHTPQPIDTMLDTFSEKLGELENYLFCY